jgi:hypothetical protein
MKDTIIAVGMIIFLFGATALVVHAASLIDWNAYNSYEPPVSVVEDVKPYTKTRCDITGLLSPTIIEEEAANGYQFDGRVTTFLCGDSGLSFHLKEVE